MPDFTVIDGGGEERDWDRALAEQELRTFIVELLRALARGDDPGMRVKSALLTFIEHAKKTKTPLAHLFETVISECHEDALAMRPERTTENERREILAAALPVIAESLTTDGFTRARQSKREVALEAAIRDRLIEKELRGRASGRSYLMKLADDVGPWPPRQGHAGAIAAEEAPEASRPSKEHMVSDDACESAPAHSSEMAAERRCCATELRQKSRKTSWGRTAEHTG